MRARQIAKDDIEANQQQADEIKFDFWPHHKATLANAAGDNIK